MIREVIQVEGPSNGHTLVIRLFEWSRPGKAEVPGSNPS